MRHRAIIYKWLLSFIGIWILTFDILACPKS
jgi:hypothetical protein